MVKINKTINNFLPLIIIFMMTLAGCYLVFYPGINGGDDYNYHIGNILDEIKSLQSEYKLSGISGNLAMGLGVGNRLFYSPLSHLTVSVLYLLLNMFQGDLFLAIEVTIVLSVFFSGIIAYRFMMHVSNDNKIASLITAGIYVLYPYRLFDAFCRFAFAEAFSFVFLPLFFMGLYDITHFKNKVNILAFIEVILGGSLLYLSHNITAVYSFTFGIFYMVISCANIWKMFKIKYYKTFCGISIVLLLGICSISWVSQVELMNTGLYNVTDTKRMWTDLATVLKRTKEQFNYAGFLNIPYLTSHYPTLFSYSTILTELVLYLFISTIYILFDISLSNIKPLKYFHLILSTALYIGLMFICSERIEFFLSCGIVIICYGYISLMVKNNKDIIDREESKIFQNILFWFSISMILICLIMMQFEWPWKVLPQLYLNIQFPWRLWAFVQLGACILGGIINTYYSPKKIAQSIFIIILGFLMVSNQPLLEKRLKFETIEDLNNTTSWHLNYDDSALDIGSTLGWNKEYCPQVFFDNTYVSKYSNSLYRLIKSKLPYNTTNYEDYYYKPVVLKGNAAIEVLTAYSPQYEMEIISEEETLIQMPLLYYPGYEITLVNKLTNEKSVIRGENIDGLVSFKMEAGTYQVSTNYVGTAARKASLFMMYGSITGVGILFVLYFLDKKKKIHIVESKKEIQIKVCK